MSLQRLHQLLGLIEESENIVEKLKLVRRGKTKDSAKSDRKFPPFLASEFKGAKPWAALRFSIMVGVLVFGFLLAIESIGRSFFVVSSWAIRSLELSENIFDIAL